MRALARLFAMILVVAVGVVSFIAFQVWSVAREDGRSPSDAIVVLGAAQYNGVPTDIFAARLEHAASLFDAGVAPMIITVGGKLDGDNFTEAGSGRAYLAELGVPQTNILAVETGNDTVGSIAAAAQTVHDLDGNTVTLVSDPTHSYRSKMMAVDEGLIVHTSPTRHGPAVWTRENQISQIVRETGAVLYYRLRSLTGQL